MDHYRSDALIPGYAGTPSDIVVNIGAHIGAFVLLAAKQASRVYGVEAAQDTFNFLRLNKALNEAANLSIHRLAISDKNGPCSLYFDTGHWGHSITKKLSTRTETVRGVTLETFFAENNIDYCDLIYLNCEGAEFPILLTTPDEVLRRVGTILADCHVHLWPHNTINDVVVRLEQVGFRANILAGDGSYDRVLATQL